jgi:hypothetical protein
MASIVKFTKDLSETEIERLFQIYFQTYGEIGTALDFDQWRANLSKPYYGKHEKFSQLFGEEFPSINAYSTVTDVVDLEGTLWSKLIEQATSRVDERSRSDTLVVMINELLALKRKSTVFHFAEVGVEYEKVLGLYRKCGFDNLNDPYLARSLLTTMFGHDDFKLSETTSGLIVMRCTGVSENKPAYIMTNYESS